MFVRLRTVGGIKMEAGEPVKNWWEEKGNEQTILMRVVGFHFVHEKEW